VKIGGEKKCISKCPNNSKAQKTPEVGRDPREGSNRGQRGSTKGAIYLSQFWSINATWPVKRGLWNKLLGSRRRDSLEKLSRQGKLFRQPGAVRPGTV